MKSSLNRSRIHPLGNERYQKHGKEHRLFYFAGLDMITMADEVFNVENLLEIPSYTAELFPIFNWGYRSGQRALNVKI